MADSDESEEGFVSRWARRKSDAKDAARRPPPAAESEEGTAADRAAGPPAEIDPADLHLPDPDTLDAEADFTVFLKEGVPEAIRRRALRRLWRLNPVLANLDGLNDYDDDFTDAATVVEGLKTLYKVGQGMVTEEDETPEEPVEADEETQGTPETAKPAAEDEAPQLEAASEQLPETREEGAAEADTSLADASASGNPEPRQAPGPAAATRRRGALERRWGGPKA